MTAQMIYSVMLADAKINCLHCCLLLVLYILVQQGISVLIILYVEMLLMVTIALVENSEGY